MSEPNRNEGHREMQRAVRLREERRERGEREGERSIWENISMIGALGWLIVIPTLLGALVGRWLDGYFDSGIQFSGTLIFLGVVLGCYLAWRRIGKA
ncbi:MAG: AtpZ/AtpI family protein [Gammaproteobacteria bacterium]